MEKTRSSLLQNDDFIYCLEIVEKYIDYLQNNNRLTENKIQELVEKSELNYNKSQEILKDFHLVNFVERDGMLYIEPENNVDDIRFRVSSLIERKNDKPILNMLKKRIDEYNKELDVVKKIEKEQRKKIEELKPEEVKKIWGIFRNSKEELRVETEYNKKLKSFKAELDKILHRIDMIELQIDSNQHIMDSINNTNKFITGLSRQEKKSILERYELIKDLFDENEKFYKDIRKLEKSQKFVLSLNGFASIHLNDEDKERYDRLLEYINKEYASVRVTQKKGNGRPETLKMKDLTKRFDFGEYEKLVNLVTKQIYASDSMSLPTCEVINEEGFIK